MNGVEKIFKTYDLNWEDLSSITTDGAKSMIGSNI